MTWQAPSRARSIAAILLAGFAIATPRLVLACSCAAPPPPLVALVLADVVFTGRAARVEDPEGPAHQRTISSGRTVTWTFGDVVAWKGDLSDSMRVQSAASGASCGYVFDVGREYLVYCTRDSTGLRTSLCSRTRPTEGAQQDLEAFLPVVIAADPDEIDATILDGFLAQVQSPDSLARRNAYPALEKLGRLDPEKVVHALANAYRIGADAERALAIQALPRKSAEHGAAKLLRAALNDASPQVRAAALREARFPGFSVSDLRSALERALEDPAPDVRAAAVSLVGLDRRPRIPVNVFSSEESVSRVLVAMRDDDPEVRMAAIHALLDYASGDLPAGAGASRGSEAHANAVENPETEQDATVRSALLRAVKDPEPNVRQAGVSALRSFHPRNIEIQLALLDAAVDRSEEVRRRAVGALGEAGPLLDESVETLIRSLADSSEQVRLDTVYALGKMGEAAARAVPALERAAVDDSAVLVRRSAERLLNRRNKRSKQ